MSRATIASLTVIVLATLYFRYLSPVEEIHLPELPETFWGPDSKKNAPKDIRPFTINIPKSVIDDLHQRLNKTRPLVPPLEGAAWTYGIQTTSLKAVLDYWRTKYDWNKRQSLLNTYPQYQTYIQGLNIHFYRVSPKNLPKDRNIKVLPLLLVHGWPGSVVEFQKIIPLLTNPRPDRDFVFEVIAPSLPGYGFSDPAVRPGLGPSQIAVIFKNLMSRLGYNKFYTQGGDWGAIITANLASLYPDSVIGAHSNMCVAPHDTSNVIWTLIGAYFPSFVVPNEYYDRMYPLSKVLSYLVEETGYMHIQASKPDTIGTAVSQSPASLAAYILEKFSTWTNKEYKLRADGGLLEKFHMDELLDNLMIYWTTNSITTSMRLYAEAFTKANLESKIDEAPVKVPSACAVFPHELMYQPESLLRKRYANLTQFTHMPRGGHFAAFEEPVLLANDIFEFVSKVES